jgi:hypothetical protein
MSDPNRPGSGGYGLGGDRPDEYGEGYGPAGHPPQPPPHHGPPEEGPPYEGPPYDRPPYPPPSGGEPQGPRDRGGRRPGNFLTALFDFGFNTFVTPMVVKFVYVLGAIAIALGWLFVVIAGFAGEQPGLGVVALLFGWIPALLYLAVFRMTLEFYYSVVRMSQDINRRLPQG